MKRLLLALLAPLTLPACDTLGQDCNLMYAPDFVQVDLLADSWEAGVWEVEVDGEICTADLPELTEYGCDGDTLSLFAADDGSALEAFSLFDAAPDTLDVLIRLDGVEVYSGVITPVYTTDEPNGEGCGERRSGVAVLDLDE